MGEPFSSVNEEWLGYLKALMIPDAGVIQLHETKKAFFAGALVIFGALHAQGHFSLTDPLPAKIEKELNEAFEEFIKETRELYARHKI